MNKKLILYLPVIHKGYIDLVEKHNADIYIIDNSVIKLIDKEFDYLRKEIRAITPYQALTALSALFPKLNISLINTKELLNLNSKTESLILPSEDIFTWLNETHLSKAEVTFDDTFLRWNRNNSLNKNKLENTQTTSNDEFVKKVMKLAEDSSQLSSDWWRQVGAVLVKDNKISSVSHNKHLPSPYTPYINSDPRNTFHKGKNIEVSSAIHAEAALISDAAKQGIKLKDSEIYVTTFPCPPCAKLIACSGIKTLYFSKGYAMIEGEQILKDSNVELIKVKTQL